MKKRKNNKGQNKLWLLCIVILALGYNSALWDDRSVSEPV